MIEPCKRCGGVNKHRPSCPVRPGPKPIAGAKRDSKVTVVLTPDESVLIEKTARKAGISVSSLLRDIAFGKRPALETIDAQIHKR